MNERRHTAIHEAGHAVIARVLGLVCGYATVEPDEECAGHGIIADPWVTVASWLGNDGKYHRSIDSALRARIISFMAGREAEEECLGSCQGGDGDDCLQIDLMLDSLLPADTDLPGYALRLRSKTRGLVRRHRATIERVAGKLPAHGKLSPRRIERAIKGRAPR